MFAQRKKMYWKFENVPIWSTVVFMFHTVKLGHFQESFSVDFCCILDDIDFGGCAIMTKWSSPHYHIIIMSFRLHTSILYEI